MKKNMLLLIIFYASFINGNYSRNIHDYILANYYDFSGNAVKAQRLFSVGDSIYSNKGRIHHWNKNKEYEKIIQIIPTTEQLFKNDAEIQLIFVNALQKVGRNNDAYQRLIQANNEFPENAQIAFATVGELVKRKELKNALLVINKLLNNAPQKPNFFVFYFLKGQIYTQLNKQQKALENIQKSIELHPQFTNGWLLFALLQEQMGNVKHAIKGYTSYLELNGGNNKKIAGHLMQLVIKDKLMDENKRGVVVNTSCFNQAITLFKQKQYKRAISYIDQCIMENPKNAKAKLFKIQILAADKQFNHAAAELRTWIKKDPNMEIWYKTLHLLESIGAQQNTILKTFEAIEQDNHNNHLASLYLADLYIRNNNHQKAIEYLNKSVQHASHPMIKTKILFQLGLLYFEKHNYTQMHAVLEKGKLLNTNFPPLLNLLAHYYATKGNNLLQAQELISNALAQDKNNIHFLDTQALIFYKQKQYTKAQQLLTELINNGAYDATIFLHLAKTEYQLKNTNNARNALKQAEVIASSAYEKQSVELMQKKLITK